MPAIDEKLKSFDKIINDDAIYSRNLIRSQLRDDSEHRMAGEKIAIDHAAEIEYEKEARRAVIERDSRISKAGINARKLLMNARRDIIASVLYELSEELALFTQTASYSGYLLKNAGEAIAAARYVDAGGAGSNASSIVASGDFCIYLTPQDFETFFGEIKKLAPGALILQGKDDMIGGVRVENNRYGLFVDNTFKKKVEMSVDDLFQISGLTIEKRI